jgi:hypothetical protein
MTDRPTRRPPQGDADLEPGFEPGERPSRDTDDWLDAVGPEDMSRDEKVELLEEYGFDLDDEDELIDLPITADAEGFKIDNGDDPDELGDELYATPVDADDNLSVRPVEDEAIEDIDGDEE